eukprot:scaffold303137_cov31-Tisochrysis_lutea.AAC.2
MEPTFTRVLEGSWGGASCPHPEALTPLRGRGGGMLPVTLMSCLLAWAKHSTGNRTHQTLYGRAT